jgi:phosphoethanolamine N-methyltransferase
VTHEDEYFDNMVTMLELVWGKGYMAPGGPGNVAKVLQGIETMGKHVLDIGCGIGGPAFEMVTTHGATVTGIDLEKPLIARATRSAAELGIEDKCRFQQVAAGRLPFDDETFDIVVSAGAYTQTADKAGILAESRRVLRRGGSLGCYEWFKSPGDYSDDMRYWFEVEGLTYALQTLEEFGDSVSSAGFDNVATEDASAWYRNEARREYALIKGELYPRMVELLGRGDADHFVENWRAMVVVLDKNEMRQGYCRARRPE